MAELREMACPECEQANHPRSTLDGIQEYRCRSCGLVYYGPCGCDTGRDEEHVSAAANTEAAPALSDGWRMTMPTAVVENGAAATSHAGGC
jgi:rubredoxin